jgi:2-methylisocitrate lyase-like PEP mutase family enzyme
MARTIFPGAVSRLPISPHNSLVRIRAAAKAREESGRDIVIIARTDSMQSLGFDEAIRRLKAAHKAGADVAFFEGLLNVEQSREAVKQLAPIRACSISWVAV